MALSAGSSPAKLGVAHLCLVVLVFRATHITHQLVEVRVVRDTDLVKLACALGRVEPSFTALRHPWETTFLAGV